MNFNLKKGKEVFKNVEENTETTIDNKEAIENFHIDTVVETKELFFSSTPKKTAECEECVAKSQCIDCRIKHMLGRQVVARALFDGWPPDKFHLLL